MFNRNRFGFVTEAFVIMLITTIILLLTGCIRKSPEQSSDNSQRQVSGITESAADSQRQTESAPQQSSATNDATNSRQQTSNDPDGAADSQRLYASTDDNIRIGEYLKKGIAQRIAVDHPLIGGTWANRETGVTLEFTEEGYVNFDRRSAGGENNRYVYQLFVDAVEVGVNSGGVISEFWYYDIDGNALSIHWSHGAGSFIRNGGNPGEAAPAVTGNTSGSPLVEGQDETSWRSEDNTVSLRFFSEEDYPDRLDIFRSNIDTDIGGLFGAFAGGFTGELTDDQESEFRNSFSYEEHETRYSINENTITVTFDGWSGGDGHTEQWGYRVSGDLMTVTWPDGSTKELYRQEYWKAAFEPDASGIIWNQDGWSIVGTWRDEDYGLFLELIRGNKSIMFKAVRWMLNTGIPLTLFPLPVRWRCMFPIAERSIGIIKTQMICCASHGRTVRGQLLNETKKHRETIATSPIYLLTPVQMVPVVRQKFRVAEPLPRKRFWE